MPVGKGSIERMAKSAATTSEPAKKRTTAKKPQTEKATPEKTVETTVIGNVSPEVVEKVIGHKEGEFKNSPAFPRVSVTEELPDYLL